MSHQKLFNQTHFSQLNLPKGVKFSHAYYILLNKPKTVEEMIFGAISHDDEMLFVMLFLSICLCIKVIHL